MPPPIVKVVVGKKKKASKRTTNPFWSQLPKMCQPPIAPVQVQQPIRLLTEVPISNQQPIFMPPAKPTLIELVDDNSPNIPGNTMNAHKTNTITINTAMSTATNPGIKPPVNPMADAPNQPGANQQKPFSNQQQKKWLRLQAKIQMKQCKNRLTWVKPNDDATKNIPGPSNSPQNAEPKQSVLANEAPKTDDGAKSTQPGRLDPSFYKNKKRLKRQQKRQRIIEKTAAAANAAGIVPGPAPNKAAIQTSQITVPVKPAIVTSQNIAVSESNTASTASTPQQCYKNKKKAKKMQKQQLIWKKSAINVTGIEPGTVQNKVIIQSSQIIVPANVTPQNIAVTDSNTASTTTAAQQFTIPTLNKTLLQAASMNTRTNAGSFFKKQPFVGSFAGLNAYCQFYPKGIPKSFLLQQNMTQEPGNQQTISPDSPVWPMQSPTAMNMNYINNPNAPTLVQTPTMDENMNTGSASIFVQTENQADVQQPYSPSDIYSEYGNNQEPCEELELSEHTQAGQKRLSAFHRLGPITQPKKPKLTINLTLNKERPVREVVNDTNDDPDRYTPVHLRKDIIMSTDETVMKYLTSWPWRKNVGIRRSATARNSRSVMILEQEQMEEAYEKENVFIQISVKGYPSTWTKEHVLNAILDSVRGYSLIPCFTEFSQHECKFLTLRSRSALIILHKTGFYIHKDGVELIITISQTDLTLNQIDFIPRIILRKRVSMACVDKKLNLSAFTLQDDISHFIYFPLSRLNNQSEFIQLQSVIVWEHLTDLDLSHNKLTDISGFDLHLVTPKLKYLNLSHNYLEKITMLLNYRYLPLTSIHLEGNPLCNDYIDPNHYIKVVRMMFPAVAEIDGVAVHRKGELPKCKQNYCPEDAREVAEKYLETFFPLLDSGTEHRSLIQGMYEDDATLTVTYCYKLRYGPIYRCFRNLFLYARFLDEGETDTVVGAMAITKLINRWPHTEHDPYTFTLDVMQHSESTTVLRVSGILKLTAESLAEDEHLLCFTRTVVLYTEDGEEYKIINEMVYWDEPTPASARSAFRINAVSQKKLNLKIESTTDEDLREQLLKIFMKLTTMDKKISERCLEINNWNFKLALEHFTRLLKQNNLDSLTKEVLANEERQSL